MVMEAAQMLRDLFSYGGCSVMDAAWLRMLGLGMKQCVCRCKRKDKCNVEKRIAQVSNCNSCSFTSRLVAPWCGDFVCLDFVHICRCRIERENYLYRQTTAVL